MKGRNTSQVALVTGGGQGIGKGIAKRLVVEGMQVVIADIDGEAAEKTAEELDCSFVEVDVADEPAVAGVIQQVLSRFGRLDALINNAGIAAPTAVPLEQLELGDWEKVMSANLTGVFLCSKHAIPLLRSSKGAIVNIASTRALQSEAHTEAYSASKGGVVALTHALAVSLGPDIRVNCVSPGWIVIDDWQKSASRRSPILRAIDQDQHPVGRVGRPEDISAMVAYLISPQAGFITGQNFVVDGGMSRRMIYAE